MDVSQSILMMLGQEESLGFGELVPAIGIVLVTMGLLMSYRKRRRRRYYEPTLTPDERVERNRQAKGMQADLEDLMVEIQELARRFSAQLDAKTITMETKLREADERIEQLERLLAQVDARLRGEGVESPIESDVHGLPHSDPNVASHSAAAQDPQLSTEPNTVSPATPNDMATPDMGGSPLDADDESQAAAGSGDPLAAEVYRLADDGLDVADISQRLSEHVGKVELILALRPGR